MRILYGPISRDICFKDFHISESHAREVVERPHQTQVIDLEPRGQVMLYARRVSVPGREFVLLVQGRPNGADFCVDAAFKVPPDIAGSADEPATPLQMLQGLAQRFGHDITIGTHRARFIVWERVPQSALNPTRLVHVDAPHGRPALLLGMMQQRNSPDGQFLECALCFALDQDAYARAIGA